MKRLLIVLATLALTLALCFGCGKRETEHPGKVPAEVTEAERMDTTRMDTAKLESTMADTGVPDTAAVDTMEMPHDTM